MGEVFAGRYELVDPIGRGGMGAVWRAWDRRRGRYVAAKVLQQSDAHTLLRFVREQALRVDHPHVLAPASWAADDDKVLFTMELVKGGSLAHLVGDHGPLPPGYVCLVLDQLLAGLGAVHAEEVVHRDVKPANILLEPSGTGRPHVRLSDFGISMRKGEPRLTETNFMVGTPGYFAPEQMRGAEADFPADLYAAGLVGLYMLTADKPEPFALIEAYEQAGGMPPAPAGVPEPLWQVLGTLLQPDPQVRFRSATGARRALADAAELLREDDATAGRGPVEVFDHIGPLPEGWGPDGPVVQGAPGLPGASETGSFHLPPPQGQFGPPGTGTPTPPLPSYTAPRAAHDPRTPPPPAAAPATTRAQPPSQAQAQAQAYGYPQQPQGPLTQVPGPRGAGHDARPPGGPSAKVAAVVLAIALLCIAVGVWALSAA